MFGVKLILRFSSGERKQVNAVYEGGLATEYIGVYPIGFKRKKNYIVYDDDIDFREKWYSSYLPVNDFERVVDIDVNSSESMKKIYDNYAEDNELLKTALDDDRVYGVSIQSRCEYEFDSAKKQFLDGYLLEKNKIGKKKMDIQTLITGVSLGFIVCLAVQFGLEMLSSGAI